MYSIEVSKLKRTFKSSLGVLNRKIKTITAVDSISFEVKTGELFGLLALTLTILITTFSTAGLGLLMGCLSLITRNVMFVNNTVYFLLLIFSGANLYLATLPRRMQSVSNILPLTRGVSATRTLIAGGRLIEILPLLFQEFLIGVVFILIGYLMFRRFEYEAKVRGTLEVF
jgi:ABC-2 type transport system permease protein